MSAQPRRSARGAPAPEPPPEVAQNPIFEHDGEATATGPAPGAAAGDGRLGLMSTQAWNSVRNMMSHSSVRALNESHDISKMNDQLLVKDERINTHLIVHLARKKKEMAENLPALPEILPEENNMHDDGVNTYCSGSKSLGRTIWDRVQFHCDIPHESQMLIANTAARERITQSRVLLDPDCLFRQCWDLIQVVLLLYMAFLLPFRVGFSIPDPLLWSSDFWLGVAIDLYFALDIYLSFVTCSYDEEGILVTEARVLLSNYLSGWFSLDLISCLPVGYISYFVEITATTDLYSGSAGGGEEAAKGSKSIDVQIVKLLKLLRLVKLLRLARLRRLIKKYETQFYTLYQRMKKLNNVVIIFVAAHWLGCMWYYVGTADDDAWVITWLSSRYKAAQGTVADLELSTTGELYLVNYYVAISTLIAGAVPAELTDATGPEQAFGLLAVVVGGFVYSNIVASITELTRKNNMEGDIKLRREAKARAMCRGRADTYLQSKVMEQFKTHLESMPALDVPDFLNCLTGDLEQEFAAQLGWCTTSKHGMINYGLLHKVPFFSSLDNKSEILVCSKLRIVNFQPYDRFSIVGKSAGTGRPITIEGQPGSDMFIILHGKVAAIEQHKQVGVLTQHQFFGELAILKPPRINSFGQLHTRTHFAVGEDAQLASLGFDDLQYLRETRAEINDAVLPYIKEAMQRKIDKSRWFYIQIDSANNLPAVDGRCSIAGQATSDPYCLLELDGHGVVGKTDVERATVDPQWDENSFAFAHTEMQGSAKLRFAV
eukprot:COSAG01_NODE_7034_length_3383_cov_4.056334_1_plen_772_part_00